jgi:hypothetical protein
MIEQKKLLSNVPAMLRRRLSPLARTALCAAIDCLENDAPIPMVFSSTHGEQAKSFAMLEMLQAGEEISPAAFSLSVHNAVAGLFSIALGNKLQSTVLAPGEDGLAPGFIEALGLLEEGAPEVLIVFYDEPVVPFYPTAPYQLSVDGRYALALRVGITGVGLPLLFYPSPEVGADGEQPLQVPAFIRFLDEPIRQLKIRTPRHSWCWEKVSE